MDKVEFSDINKFFASLGLILIGLALFLPWLISQYSTSLFIEKEKFDKLSPAAMELIMKQQEYLISFHNCLPWLSLILFIIGLTFLIYGLIKWSRRQSVIDQIQDEELKSKRHQNLTLEERKEIKQIEMGDIESQDIKSDISKYIAIEDKIYHKLLPYYNVNYDTIPNVRIGPYNYDIILKSKFVKVRADLILEVKYYKGKMIYNRLLDSTMQFLQAINNYENSLQRAAIPIIIFIYAEEIEKSDILKYKENLNAATQEKGKKVRVKFFKESELDSLGHTEILTDN